MLTFPSFINIAIVLVPFTIFLVSSIYLLKTYFLRREHLLRAATIVFIVVFLTVIFKIIASAGLQYYVWSQGGGLGEYFLPPHQSINYFFGYSWNHFVISPAIGVSVSLLLVAYFFVLNKVFKKQYLDLEDMFILVSGSLMAGWPNIVVYLGIAFLLTIFRIFYLFYIRREARRVPLTGALIIAAFLTLLAGDYLAQVLQLGFLRV